MNKLMKIRTRLSEDDQERWNIERRKSRRKRTKGYMFLFVAILLCVTVTSFVLDNDETDAAPGDRFIVGGIQYRVLSENPNAVEVISNSYTGVVNIPSSVYSAGVTYTVTKIGDSAFSERRNLTYVNIPDSVTSIGNRAFWICHGLTSIYIPDSVTSIGDSAFELCINLLSINIPVSVTSIGDSAFSSCNGMYSATILGQVVSFGNRAFSYCSSLNLVVMPSVTSIGNNAFDGCSSLTSITIPNSVTSIGHYAFSYCSNLTSITIPNSVTSIGGYAFYYCSSLTWVTMSNFITHIGEQVFRNCSELRSITIPNSVTSIGSNALVGCSNLSVVAVPDGLNINSAGLGGKMIVRYAPSLIMPGLIFSVGASANGDTIRLSYSSDRADFRGFSSNDVTISYDSFVWPSGKNVVYIQVDRYVFVSYDLVAGTSKAFGDDKASTDRNYEFTISSGSNLSFVVEITIKGVTERLFPNKDNVYVIPSNKIIGDVMIVTKHGYIVSVVIAGGGSVGYSFNGIAYNNYDPSSGGIVVERGKEVYLKAVQSSGNKFFLWSSPSPALDDNAGKDVIVFTVSDDTSLIATFIKNPTSNPALNPLLDIFLSIIRWVTKVL